MCFGLEIFVSVNAFVAIVFRLSENKYNILSRLFIEAFAPFQKFSFLMIFWFKAQSSIEGRI